MRPIDQIEKRCSYCTRNKWSFNCTLQRKRAWEYPCMERHQKVCKLSEEEDEREYLAQFRDKVQEE